VRWRSVWGNNARLIFFFFQPLFFFAFKGNAVFDLHGHEGVVRDLVFPQNGTLTLISSSRDKTLRIWDLAHKGARTVVCVQKTR